MKPTITFLHSSPSTNSYLTARSATTSHGEAVVAHTQTAGRGQRGNSWESHPGENLTLSVALHPKDIDIATAFPLSEAVAMAAVATINELMPDSPEPVAVKWPNDIYVGNRKIAGILIENSLSGRKIKTSVAGIGLNVNQQRFLSNAPNPVSIRQLIGRQYAIPVVAATFMRHLNQMLTLMENDPDSLHATYMENLWRNSGTHPFRNVATGQRFEAAISSVAPSGHITLCDIAGHLQTFAFKEIEWII